MDGSMTNQGMRAASPALHSAPAEVLRLPAPAPAAAPWYERHGDAWMSLELYERIKRTLDVILVATALPVVLPVLGLCALAIRIDSPGSVVFHQSRTGKGGRRFRMYKLRTMLSNAEELKAQYMHLNELQWPDFKITDDPRITRIGRFLRKTSLDELPQLLNVLRGDMSLVGPRPTSFSSTTYDLWHTARLELRPGLTGLWQVSGRNELEFNDRVRLDIAYQRNRSVWLDVRIMMRTVSVMFTHRGAH
jgi:lipopolysaccharide/colanic/teichoic acid biosynthesis glycosyltransferase